MRDFPKAPAPSTANFLPKALMKWPTWWKAIPSAFQTPPMCSGYSEPVAGRRYRDGWADGADHANPVPVSDDIIGMINKAPVRKRRSVDRLNRRHDVETPIILAHTCAGETASVLRHSVSVGEGATATFIEHHHSSTIANHQNVVSNLTVGKGCKSGLGHCPGTGC